MANSGERGQVQRAQTRRTFEAKSPCGRAIRISTTVSNVTTRADEPERKNSLIDWVCAMPKAEATVPSKLAAPPNVTTRNESTIYSDPLVGPVEPIVVNAAPATPAMPQPIANVSRSVRLVSIPAALAIVRLLTVARTRRPQRERYMAASTPAVSTMARHITNRPLIGMSRPGAGDHDPISQSGSVGLTSFGPKVERNICCIARLRPQVASRVSNCRRYKWRISSHSTIQPNTNAMANAATIASGRNVLVATTPIDSAHFENTYTVYAPMVMNSPCAMLITPICPKITARPSPINSNTLKRLRPAKPCISVMFRISVADMADSLVAMCRAWRTNSCAMRTTNDGGIIDNPSGRDSARSDRATPRPP